jgi:hypothetical protein
MAANGKGNGKKGGASASSPPVTANGKAVGHDGGGGHDGGDPHTPAPGGLPRSSHESEPPASSTEEAETPPVAAAKVEPAESEPVSSPAPVAPAPAPAATGPRGAAWAHPIVRFEERWTWLESRLLTFVLLWQILALVAWVFLNGLSESVTTVAGCVFRVVIVAIALGAGVWRAGKNLPENRRRDFTLLALAVAVGMIVLWQRAARGGAGAALSLDHGMASYFDNVKGWLQEGSTLTLLGGLRGLGTRLTLWLALLGGSLATASGKHIHVDVVFRFIPKNMRLPVAILNYLFAATVCFAGVWGFFDHVAIESYGSHADDSAGAKIDNAVHHIGNHAFFTRKQLGLDLHSLPHVVKGERYDQWMTAAAWNEWVDGAGFEPRFEHAKVQNLHIPDGTHPPFIVSPDGETTRSVLAHTLGLVFPFGLLAIGLRFLLRALLTLTGHYEVDPDEAHKEEIGAGNAPVTMGDAPKPPGGAS